LRIWFEIHGTKKYFQLSLHIDLSSKINNIPLLGVEVWFTSFETFTNFQHFGLLLTNILNRITILHLRLEAAIGSIRLFLHSKTLKQQFISKSEIIGFTFSSFYVSFMYLILVTKIVNVEIFIIIEKKNR